MLLFLLLYFKGVIHSETSSGVLNRVEQIGKVVKHYLPGLNDITSFIKIIQALFSNGLLRTRSILFFDL